MVGKHSLPSWYYKGLWDEVGDGTKPTQQIQTVELNGLTQLLYLFEQPTLQELQLEHLAMTTEQAIGRSRALTETTGRAFLSGNFTPHGVDEVRA